MIVGGVILEDVEEMVTGGDSGSDDGMEVVEVAGDGSRDDGVTENYTAEDEVVIVGIIPCPHKDRRNEEQGERQPIVYQRRRSRKQGEQSEPQPQEDEAPVPNLSPNSSPPPQQSSVGNASSILEHVELPLAQRRDPRVNAGKPSSRYGYEHDIANYISDSRVLFRRTGGAQRRTQSEKMQ